jgi:2-keto-3-deoxy-L-rhamnonate aldolase RhmA
MSTASMLTRPPATEFRRRLLAHELLIGTFVKTPHPCVIELLGSSPLDCACLDAEHAPFDRSTLDVGLLAGRAANLPVLVRIPRAHPADILNALDLGAAGVVIPHVASAEDAQAVARAARYGPGVGRGYAGSTRAAGYGSRSMSDVIDDANRNVVVIAQIEDAAALEHLDAIAGVEGIDALFIGRMDLTVSLGARSPNDEQVINAVQAVCASARRHSRAVGMFTPTVEEARRWTAEGASLFLLASDQQWIVQGARELVAALRAADGGPGTATAGKPRP